jgi:hypothetical protein
MHRKATIIFKFQDSLPLGAITQNSIRIYWIKVFAHHNGLH